MERTAEELRLARRMCTLEHYQDVIIEFVVSAIMLVIVIGNSLVVAAITRDRQRLGGVQNYFIASLAVSDQIKHDMCT